MRAQSRWERVRWPLTKPLFFPGEDPDDASLVDPFEVVSRENGVQGLIPGHIDQAQGDGSLNLGARDDLPLGGFGNEGEYASDIGIDKIEGDPFSGINLDGRLFGLRFFRRRGGFLFIGGFRRRNGRQGRGSLRRDFSLGQSGSRPSPVFLPPPISFPPQ